MTHSYFAEMGGFVFDEGKESPRTITSYEFLRLCEKGRITNPLITAKQIEALSKSDALGKAVFMLQLVWFMLQVVVRGWMDLAITLVELDTVCMAVLALLYIFFWWDKPHQPDCPHIFYQTEEAKIYSKEKLYGSHYQAMTSIVLDGPVLQVESMEGRAQLYVDASNRPLGLHIQTKNEP